MSNAESVGNNASAGDDPDAFPRPFGQYLLLENFARGGMGEVYLAKSGGIAGLERYCVLKKLRSELTRDREYVTRFIDEARVVVTLQHANICHVFDVGRVGEEYYLAMEYISGRDVRTAQDRSRTKERRFPPATALHLVCETLEALDYAHRRNHPLTGEPLNLVHRDVSPQNVLVSFEGEVKLIDFGLAASRLKVERTQPNVVMGKMAYMAPEQARGDPIDARADLFACGVLAYELLSGERFYEGMTANDIWQVAGKGGFSPRRWSALDHEVQRHLGKALHPDPKKRYATCGDFREALASHMHWKYPGSGVRGLREVMKELFADEIRKEDELRARFGKVTVAGFRTEFEESRSTSVTLARADEPSTHHAASKGARVARVVRNEQSSSTPAGAMPPPGNFAVGDRSHAGSGAAEGRDVHREATLLVGSGKASGSANSELEGTDAMPKPERSTDEQASSGPNATKRGDLAREPTQIVSRRRVREAGTELVVRPLSPPDDDDVTVAATGRRWMVLVAGAAAVMAVVMFMFIFIFVLSGGGKAADHQPQADAKAAAAAEAERKLQAQSRAEAEQKAAAHRASEESEEATKALEDKERLAKLENTDTKKEKAERRKREKEKAAADVNAGAEREAREAERQPPAERSAEKPKDARKTAVTALRDGDVIRVANSCGCKGIVVQHTMGAVPMSDVRACLVANLECALPK